MAGVSSSSTSRGRRCRQLAWLPIVPSTRRSSDETLEALGAGKTIRRLRREKQASDRRLDDMLRRGPNGTGGTDPTAQARAYEDEENRRLAAAQERENLGEAGAVSKYYHDRTVRETRGITQFQQNQSFEREDERDFRAACRADPALSSVASYVEQRIATARANGNYVVRREDLADHRLGQLLRERRAAKLDKAQGRASAQRQRQTVRTPRAQGSDAVAPRRGGRRSEADMSVEDFERSFGTIPITR